MYTNLKRSDEEMLNTLQRETFAYFIKEVNSNTGLIADKTQPGSPSSIAATGLGLSCYIAGIERGFITRADAVKRTLTVLQFFLTATRALMPMHQDTKDSIITFLICKPVSGQGTVNCLQ